MSLLKEVIMGDKIIIESIEVIQDGLFQIDFKNVKTEEYYRCFIEPDKLFGMIGEAMQENYNKYLDRVYGQMNKKLIL
jgi:hypothetical protein